jgi:hypothetical protein
VRAAGLSFGALAHEPGLMLIARLARTTGFDRAEAFVRWPLNRIERRRINEMLAEYARLYPEWADSLGSENESALPQPFEAA